MVWQQYKNALTRYPLAVKATTAATLMSCSDILGQTYERSSYRKILTQHEDSNPVVDLQKGCPVNTKRSSNPDEVAASNNKLLHYDWQRTLHVGVTGLTFSGPISHAWYNLLEAMVGRMALVTTAFTHSSLIIKLLLDAVLFSPIAVAGYFVWRSILEGTSVQWKLEHKWLSALQASWSFWPLANVVNFSMVPLQFRVLYNNGLSLLWNAYLSNVNQSRLEQVVDRQAICSHCRPVRG